jgi:hypothetical protein
LNNHPKGASAPFFIAAISLLLSRRRFGTLARASPEQLLHNLEGAMKNPLDSIWGTVISGVVLTLILYNVVGVAQ